MTKSTRSFARLARLYSTVERTRALHLGLTLMAEQEAAQARDAVAAEWTDAVRHGRAALAVGTEHERRLALTAVDMCAVNARCLDTVCEQRKAATVSAREHYQQSRLQADQMQRADERIRLQRDQDELRSMQRLADDRFSSRLAWARTRKADEPA